ncbi:MAG TPA: hypothetical protein VGX51_06800, partial [Solirubrobacteraceae bacterium]|nr:hypothetical protein [Solirubrobacteraceae bacterium]
DPAVRRASALGVRARAQRVQLRRMRRVLANVPVRSLPFVVDAGAEDEQGRRLAQALAGRMS